MMESRESLQVSCYRQALAAKQWAGQGARTLGRESKHLLRVRRL